MAVDEKCLTCDTYRDECVGKDEACAEFKSIDWRPTAVILPTIPPTIVHSGDHEHATPPIPVNESRREKFARIGKKRQMQALEAIRKLEHLTSRYHRSRTDITVYTYEWTAEEAIELVRPITEALANLQAELIACDIPYEHGRIEENDNES